MKKVIAALDNSLAAKPVLSAALTLGGILGAEVEAVHVAVDGDRVARNAAAAERLPLRTAEGPVVDRLIEEGLPADVIALALGARGTPAGCRPLGSTAVAVATSLQKPVLIVPPDARRPGELRRVLVPLEGPGAASRTPRTIIELAQGEELEVVVLHVREEESLPLFTDQPQHEQRDWLEEFLRRYCPWGIGAVQVEVRAGRSDELVPLVAEQTQADLIALGWSQELAEGRAPVVRAALTRASTPVLLVPVVATPEPPPRAENE